MSDGRMEITQVGRWRFELTYYPDDESWVGLEGPTVIGRKRAERRARRDLRRLSRIFGPHRVVSTVRDA